MKIIERNSPQLFCTPREWETFLGLPVQAPEALEQMHQQIQKASYPREEVSRLLCDYNSAIANDSLAQQNIERLKSPDSQCVVTGQQLGLMGGPSYTILKAITCLLAAREMNAIPLFWLATEDHDVDEINHTYLIHPSGNLDEYRVHFPKGHFVEDLFLNAKHIEVIHHFAQEVGLDEFSISLSEGVSYAKWTAALLAKQFAGTGLVFAEPHLFRPLSRSFFQKEIREAESIVEVLQGTTQRFVAAGGEPLLHFQEGTNLFFKDEGYRRKIHKKGDALAVGKQTFSLDQLLRFAERNPEHFSTNVAARPVLQSLLLPTIAYVAGPNEWRYYHQLEDYHRFHGTLMPLLVPRLSATLLPPYAVDLLERCRLNPWDDIPVHWHQVIPDLDDGLSQMTDEWKASAFKHFADELSEDVLERYIRQGADKVKKRLLKARLSKQGLPYHALHYLGNLIHPHERLQERVLNWWTFQEHSQENRISEFLQNVEWNRLNCRKRGHLFVYL